MANIMKLFKKDKLEKMKEGIMEERAKPVDELLSARVMALDEARKATSERFLTVAEQIGDLRAEHRSLEASLRELSLKSTKAVDLVASVQPEALSNRIRQQDSQIKAMEARLEQVKDFHDEVIKELKGIRTQVGLFRGIDQTIKLNKEAQEKLIAIEKIDHGVKMHADRVADMFAAVKKDFDRIAKVETLSKETRKEMDSAMTSVNSMHAKVQNILTKEDLESLHKEQEKVEEELMSALNRCKEEIAKCYAVVEKADKIEQASTRTERVVNQAQKLNMKQERSLAQLTKRLDRLEKESKAKDKRIKELEKKVKRR